jgi:hypothetical protein
VSSFVDKDLEDDDEGELEVLEDDDEADAPTAVHL